MATGRFDSLPAQSLRFFFFNDTATTEIYTLSLHDALPISAPPGRWSCWARPIWTSRRCWRRCARWRRRRPDRARSEEHTSELQSQSNLVCRLLLEKKKIQTMHRPTPISVITTHVAYYEAWI